MKEHKKYLSIFAVLLLAVFAIVCVLGVACKKDKDEEPEPTPVTHTHNYTASWEWGDDYTCSVTLTCTSTEGKCDTPTVTDKATVTPATDPSTCTVAGSTTYTASYTYGDTTYTNSETKTVTLLLADHVFKEEETTEVPASCEEPGVAAHWECENCDTLFVEVDGEKVETTLDALTIPATGHAYPAPDDENFESLVTWDWENRDETNKTVNVTVECTVCHETEIFTAEYGVSDNDKTLSATAEVGNYEYSSTYDLETGESSQSAHTHSYTASWDWAETTVEGETVYTCTLTLTCSNGDGNCHAGEVTVEADVTSTTIGSTCTEKGSVTYTATATHEGTTYTTDGDDLKVVELPLAEHVYKSVDGVEATCQEAGVKAHFECENCDTLFVEENEEKVETTLNDLTISATGHTYPDTTETSNIQWNWETRSGDETSGTVSVTLLCTVCGNEIGTYDTTYSVSGDGTTWSASYTVEDKTYTSNYPVSGESSGETSEAVIELNFTGSDFAEATLLTEGGATGDVALKYADGAETDFTVKGSKSDYKSVTISSVKLGEDSGEYRQALVFNGSATNEKNSLAYTLDAGTYKIVLSYFNTNTGRYATVLNASGNEYVELVAEEDKTDGTYDVFTREIYITLEASSTIYIGSKSNGLSITYIGIFEADSIPEYTVTGVSLSDSEITLEVGKENEISAIVTLSDGKTYKEYDGTFTWSLEGAGVVSLPDTTKFSASFTGVTEGTETITVSINGCTASCAVTVVAAAEVTLVPVVEVDFTASGNFTSGTEILAANSGTTADIKYADGTSTGLTAIGTDSSNTKIEITTQNGTVVLKTNGTGKTTKGSVSYTFAEDGTYSVVISYMQNNSNARWGVVLDAEGKELGDSVKESEKTDTNYTVKTRTVTFDAVTGDTIYIGSNDSGLYFTFIGIYKVEESSGDTGSGSGDSGSDDSRADGYEETISFSPESLTVEVSSEASFTFTVNVTLNGDTYIDSDIDIAVQSDDTSVATESWNSDTSTVTVAGVPANGGN